MATIRVEDSGGKHVAVVMNLEQNICELIDFCSIFSTKCAIIRFKSKFNNYLSCLEVDQLGVEC